MERRYTTFTANKKMHRTKVADIFRKPVFIVRLLPVILALGGQMKYIGCAGCALRHEKNEPEACKTCQPPNNTVEDRRVNCQLREICEIDINVCDCNCGLFIQRAT